MEDLKNLPNDKGENLARFFEKMEVKEIQVMKERRHSSLIPHSKDIIPHSKDSLASMGDSQWEETASPRLSTSEKSEWERLYLSAMKRRNLHLSIREQAKLNAMSHFRPGEIHSIPLNDAKPLPRIKTEAEKMAERNRQKVVNGVILQMRPRKASVHRFSDIQNENFRQNYLRRQPLEHQICDDRAHLKHGGGEESLNPENFLNSQFHRVSMDSNCSMASQTSAVKRMSGYRMQVPVTKAIHSQRNRTN
ncbi:uncharacterized protein LOC125681300 [Ostrea edulis]|uniref:uncharacterized protein LOC125681300 n=1 Tax=Ostrea edulis TaxID=37623 RepID=UPI0024AFF1B0|nr:uncharacterized protein LOC125681300 [Ostrea edulis]